MNLSYETVKKHGFTLAIVSSILTLTIFRLLSYLCNWMGLYKKSDTGLVSVTGIFIRLAMIGLLLVLSGFYGIRKEIYFKTYFSWRTLPMCWVTIVYSVIMVLTMLPDYIKKGSPVILSNAVLLVLSMLILGVFEELTTRGIAFALFKRYFGSSGKNLKKAIVCQGILFGLLHIMNLFSSDVNVYWVIGQIIFASASGIYWGAVYERSHNFWVVVLLHALGNSASSIGYLFEGAKGAELPVYSWPFVVMSILVAIPYLLTAGFLMRKQKTSQVPVKNTNFEMIKL